VIHRHRISDAEETGEIRRRKDLEVITNGSRRRWVWHTWRLGDSFE
jgi:hypothetical protein